MAVSLRTLAHCVVALLVGYVAAVACVAVLAGCTTEDVIKETTGETPAEIIERECRERMLACALVYEFINTPAETPSGVVELCVLEEHLPLAEALYGPSRLSQDERFAKWALLGVPPACLWFCPSATGCNAFGGAPDQGSCFCPVTP